MKLEQDIKTRLEDELDDRFPKGKCKERGQALMLFATAMIEVKDVIKAFGKCTYCFGKGYGTQTVYASSSRHDEKMPTLVFCKCERGKQLKKHLTECVKWEI